MKPASVKTKRQAKTTEAWQAAGVCIFLALAVLAVFGPAAGFEFVNCDDNVYVYDNPKVTGGLNLQNMAWVFTHPDCNFYHPLTMLSLMLDYQLHGLHAGGYHLTNLLIHAASSVLLFLILRQMTGAFWRSAFVATVFAVHPLRVESVAWVAERKDVLGTFFFMLTLGAYVRYVQKPGSPSRYWSVAGLYTLGLLCKPSALALPFALLLLDYWPLGRLRHAGNKAAIPFWQLVREKVPWMILAAVASVVTYFAEGKAVISVAHLPVLSRIGNAAISYVAYLRQTIYPARLAVFYYYPREGYPLWEIGLSFLVLAVVTGFVAGMWRKRPWLMVGWLWYLGMLVPMIGLVAISPSVHGDRNTYLAQIGLSLAAAWAVGEWSAAWKHRRMLLGVGMVVVVGVLMLCGRNQTSYWKDSETLWRHAVACSASDSVARNNLGYALMMKGDLNEAIEEYHKALEIEPDYLEAYENLGNALVAKGELGEAIAQCRQAVTLAPGVAGAQMNLANALAQSGRLEEAIAQYHKTLEINPDSAQALYNLGKTLLLKGDLDQATSCLQKAAGLDPDQVATWHELGDGFLRKGESEQAIAAYRRAMKINPRYGDTCAKLGMAYLRLGELKESKEAWQQALEFDPNQVSVLNNLAWVLAAAPEASLRDGVKAVELASQANRLSGGNPAILHTLAAAYAEEGSYALATSTARRALDLALEQKNEALAGNLQNEIKLYESGAPVRVAPSRADNLKP